MTIHPDQARLIPFRRPPRTSRQDDSDHGGPGTFDLLGFTHYWGLSLKGNWVVKRKTAKSRFSRVVRAIHQWCKAHRHRPLAEQQHSLSQKMRGHYAYYGVTGNAYALSRFQDLVQRIWRTWLGRRKRDGQITWDVFKRLLRRYPLPMAVVVHSVYRRAAKS